MADDAVIERVALLEQQVEELRRDVASLLALAAAVPTASAAEPVVTGAHAEAPASTPPPVAAEPERSPLQRAWRALERGDPSRALNEGFEAIRLARVSGDTATLGELAAFAAAASASTDGRLRQRADQLLLQVDVTQKEIARRRVPAPAAMGAPAVAGPRSAAPPPPVPAARRPAPGPTFSQRAVTWLRAELTGGRAFALVGGSVMLLGVIFLFVLAANAGWIGPAARVAFGAAVSVAMVGVGIALRARYGRYQAALAAVGAGIAGAYTTLAAATILYSYLPSWGALVVAAGIAAVGGWLGVAWSSELLAGLALVGAAAAPGLVGLEDRISWPGPAFALVVLAASIAVASPRRWLWLLNAVGAVAVAQVVWLAADAPLDDPGAVVVTCIASLVLLAAAIAWQAYGEPGLDGPAALFALGGAGIALWSPLALLSERGDAGLVLLGLALVFAAVALAIRTHWQDLAWTIAAGALLLGGVATAYLVSGRSLTVVWGIEAAVLAALAWKLRTPRFAAAALAYLAAGVVHALAVEIVPAWPDDAFDVPRGAAPGLFVLAFASLATGLLLPPARADRPSQGILAALEPTWDALVRLRIELRATLAGGAAIMLAAATAAVLSGRWLTILWAVLAATLGAVTFAFGERRLQLPAVGFMAVTVVHALGVEAPLKTLALDRLDDPLAPVASLVALAAAAAVLAALARFETRGIAWLGPLSGPERRLAVLRREQEQVRATLGLIAAAAAAWAAGLVAIEISYEPGQIVATALWSVLGTAVVWLAARARAAPWQGLGGAIVLLALLKAAAFDWDELGDGAATTSLLVVASALLVAGFLLRWENPTEPGEVELISLAAGAVATAAAIVALERVLDIDSRGLGVATLAVVAATAAAGVPPYLRRRAGRAERWLRTLANGYWALALGALLFAETELVLRGERGTMALWGATAVALALAWKPLAEDRAWLAALGLTAVAGLGSLALVTPPSRLVEASAHPATGLWAFAVVVAAAWAVALVAPPAFRSWTAWVLGSAAGLTLYGVSLGVLDLAERVSTGSVETDFQRGHTALSALWGAGALVLYVVGLARDRSDLRVIGLALFGLALAKLFLYDLSSLSSITRAFSFLAVGAILLVAGFFAERLVGPGDDRPTHGTRGPRAT